MSDSIRIISKKAFRFKRPDKDILKGDGANLEKQSDYEDAYFDTKPGDVQIAPAWIKNDGMWDLATEDGDLMEVAAPSQTGNKNLKAAADMERLNRERAGTSLVDDPYLGVPSNAGSPGKAGEVLNAAVKAQDPHFREQRDVKREEREKQDQADAEKRGAQDKGEADPAATADPQGQVRRELARTEQEQKDRNADKAVRDRAEADKDVAEGRANPKAAGQNQASGLISDKVATDTRSTPQQLNSNPKNAVLEVGALKRMDRDALADHAKKIHDIEVDPNATKADLVKAIQEAQADQEKEPNTR